MKKVLFLMLASVAGLFTAQAQEKKVEVSPETFTFQPHWFTQIQAGAAYTRGEAKFGDLISPAAALNFGYKFNKLFALRFGASGWEGKGSWVNPRNNYKYNYIQGNLDAMLDLSTLFAGYNHKRVFNAYLFGGVGCNFSFNNDEAVDLQANPNINFEYLWDDNKVFAVGRLGLGADFRITDRFAINIEANANVLSDKFNSKKAGNADWQFNALVGLKFNLNKPYKHTPAVYEIVQPEPEPIVEPEPEPQPEPQPQPEVVKPEPMQVNIQFLINKSIISKEEGAKLDQLAAYMVKYPETKAEVTGYADKNTGNARINQRLSIQRADAAKAYLVNKGIHPNRIATFAKGDTVQPFSKAVENRVSICIAK